MKQTANKAKVTNKQSFFTFQPVMNRKLSSIKLPSRFMMVESIFKMAALMVRGGGNLVIPMLIAFDRFVSNKISSFFLPSAFFCSEEEQDEDEDE
jgi:hypothetical protein